MISERVKPLASPASVTGRISGFDQIYRRTIPAILNGILRAT